MASTLRFEAPVSMDESIADGYMKHFVTVPTELAQGGSVAGKSRLRGWIDGAPFSRAVFRTPDGELRLRFGMGWLRDAGLSVGDMVTIVLDEDQDPDRVDVPNELALFLGADPVVEHLWEELTPGRQRSLVYGVEQAKRPETKHRRARAVVDELLAEFGLD